MRPHWGIYPMERRAEVVECLHDGQDVRGKAAPGSLLAEQRDRMVGATLLFGLSYFHDGRCQDGDGVLPNFWNVNSSNWQVKEFCHEGSAILSQIAKMEPSGPGRWKSLLSLWQLQCLSYCSYIQYEGSMRWWRFTPLISLLRSVLGGWTGNKLPVEGFCNCLWAGVSFSLKVNWVVWWRTWPLAA